MPTGPEAVEEEGIMETLRLHKPPNGDILLEKDCPKCFGYGYNPKAEWETCKTCNGTGLILTENGRTIIELMKKYGETK